MVCTTMFTSFVILGSVSEYSFQHHHAKSPEIQYVTERHERRLNLERTSFIDDEYRKGHVLGKRSIRNHRMQPLG